MRESYNMINKLGRRSRAPKVRLSSVTQRGPGLPGHQVSNINMQPHVNLIGARTLEKLGAIASSLTFLDQS